MSSATGDKRDVLLSGASGTIGNAMAHVLAKAGFNLHLTSRDPERLVSLKKQLISNGVQVHVYTLDLKDSQQAIQTVDEFFEQAERPFGLICNAGDLGALGPFMEMDFRQWSESLQHNFLGHAAMIHRFLECFSSHRLHGGRIVTLSGAGLGGNAAFSNVTSYSTAKAALTHLSEALASEVESLGITINAIAPGAVFSRFTEQAIEAGDSRLGDYAASARKCKETGGVPPQLAAELTAFLMSPGAAGITGRLLSARFDQERLRRDADRIADNPHLFRLRRIDEELFSPSPEGKPA